MSETSGIIIGGWPYVIAAYSITAVGLVGYFWSLLSRLRKARSAQHNSRIEE